MILPGCEGAWDSLRGCRGLWGPPRGNLWEHTFCSPPPLCCRYGHRPPMRPHPQVSDTCVGFSRTPRARKPKESTRRSDAQRQDTRLAQQASV